MVENDTTEIVPVAIIIPCYNHAMYIGQTIEGVLGQTVKPAEIIVIDDGSTDNTPEVCGRYKQIRYMRKENGGVSSARNLGFRESTAEYVTFHDSDDLLHPKALELMWRAVNATGSEAKAVFGRSVVFQDTLVWPEDPVRPDTLPESVVPHVEKEISPEIVELGRTLLGQLVRRSIIPQSASIVLRSVYDEVGLWDERFLYHQDREIWLRIASVCKIGFVNREIHGYRRHETSITHKRHFIRNHLEVVDLLDSIVVGPWADDYLRGLARREYVRAAYYLGQRLAEHGSYGQAAGLMKRAWARGPLFVKAAIRMAQYALAGLFKDDQGEPAE